LYCEVQQHYTQTMNTPSFSFTSAFPDPRNSPNLDYTSGTYYQTDIGDYSVFDIIAHSLIIFTMLTSLFHHVRQQYVIRLPRRRPDYN
jgi:hypothetical protein